MYITGQYLQGTYRVEDKAEGGWVKHGSHRDQSGIIVDDSDINDGQEYTKSASPPLSTPPPKCIPVMSLMCERMKTGKKLVICWGHVCTFRAEAALLTSSSMNLNLLDSLVKTWELYRVFIYQG